VRAVVCITGGTEVAEVPDPVPAPDGVVVEVAACGLCGSDVHAIEHGRTAEGQILGHEFGGRVVEVGRNVTGVRIGQPVAVNPHGSCGECRECRRGLQFRCSLPNLGLTAPGGYAEYAAVPAGQLVPLPEDVPLEWAAHAEPLAVAMHAVRLARVGHGDAALVYGVGTIGLNAIMALKAAGVDLVVGAGRSPGRRAAARAVGADVVLDSRETTVGDHVAATGRPFDAVLECSAAPGAIAESLAVLGSGGVCVEVALTEESAPVPLLPMVGAELTLVGSCAFSYPEFRTAVDAVVGRSVPVPDLISERVGLADTPDALVRLRRPGDLVRVLTVPGR
jgi:(R,R)-butanediol dehydrogenase / meso-butanediol dehydrogenase / diacetyl reductase